MGGSAGLKAHFKTLLEAFTKSRDDATQFVFDFTRIKSEYKDPNGKVYTGTFWVTGDALKYRLTRSDDAILYDTFMPDGAVHDPYDPLTPGRLEPSPDPLVRLPCTAPDNQAVADVITTHPHPTETHATSGLVNYTAKVLDDMAPASSLLLTPYLCDLRYMQAGLKVGVYNQDVTKTVESSALLHRKLNEEIAAKVGDRTSLPNIVADAGKIWAIHSRVYEDAKEENGTPYKAVINYGWHGPGQVLNAVSNNLKVAQSVGGRHNAKHIDYSQMAYLVAGWCEITSPDRGLEFMLTDRVYQTKPYCNLVVHDGVPLKRTTY